MARNPFTDDSFPQGKLNRNSFDLSRRSVFTTDFFKLYPYLCQEVLPGDSFEIDARIGIRGMPTVFPVQTRVRISTEFYLVRCRTLMKNKLWEDFVFKNKDIELPWLKLNNDRAKRMISTGSLGDALGVPTTVGSSGLVSVTSAFKLLSVLYYFDRSTSSNVYFPSSLTLDDVSNFFPVGVPLSSYPTTSVPSPSNMFSIHYLSPSDLLLTSDSRLVFPLIGTGSPVGFSSIDKYAFILIDFDDKQTVRAFDKVNLSFSGSSFTTARSFSDGFLTALNDIVLKGHHYVIGLVFLNVGASSPYAFSNYISNSSYFYYFNYLVVGSDANDFYVDYNNVGVTNVLKNSVLDSTDDSVISSNPFVGDDPAIRLSALKFRAYEQVTNYYYVNEKNNPLVFNGQVEYNEFLPSYDAGPDTNVYDFHYRNWELDQYTSALQTPQMGEAPLVGVIFTGDKTAELTFQGSLDDESPSDIKVTVGLDDDDNVEQILDFPSEMPSADLQRLQQRIQAGFSINQFRVTNSFQRFLENSLFRGRRYRNQMKSHHRVSVDFPDIDIPQYIGGASSIMDVGQVTNTADSPNAGLGDYIGTLQGGVSTRNKIRCYCPEHGFILAIVSFCPIPSYAQAIDKSLIKRDALDYFNPEFGKIGFVPVRYSELSPLQTPVGGSVHDVFGYQKAWYEYMAALDEVHGDFRTTLAPFVLTRTFAERPQLSSSFTVGSPEQLNDIFVTQNIVDAYNSSAKFLASAEINIKALRQIPIVGTPSLE